MRVPCSFSNQVEQFIDNPSTILNVLGTAAPSTAIFFLTFLMLQASAGARMLKGSCQ